MNRTVECKFGCDMIDGSIKDGLKYLLLDLCNSFEPKIPLRVYSTSSYFYQKFFVQYESSRFDKQIIALLALYVALKVEECNISLEVFINIAKPKDENTRASIRQNILDLELDLLSSLNFKIKVDCPFLSFRGLTLQMSTLLDYQIDDKQMQLIEQKIHFSLLSDLYLRHTSSQVALSCIDVVVGRKITTMFLRKKLQSIEIDITDELLDKKIEKLLEVFDSINLLLNS